jgi:uncharacterized protein YecT (DUF1311 family)
VHLANQILAQGYWQSKIKAFRPQIARITGIAITGVVTSILIYAFATPFFDGSFSKQLASGSKTVASTSNIAVERQNLSDRTRTSINTRATEQPSFSCNKAAKGIELMICRDTELARADRLLGEAYKERIARVKADDRNALINSQRKWINERNDKCNVPTRVPTIDEAASAKPCILLVTEKELSGLMPVSSDDCKKVYFTATVTPLG